MTFYWATTNIITLIQAKLLRIQAIREKLKIPKLIQFDKDKLPIKDKGFRETIRESESTQTISEIFLTLTKLF